MRRSLCGGILVLALLAGAAAAAAAQETGTPIFRAPYRAFETHEFGGSLSDPEGASVALEGFYRYGKSDERLRRPRRLRRLRRQRYRFSSSAAISAPRS